MLPPLWAQVPSLAREPTSCLPCSTAKRKKKAIKNVQASPVTQMVKHPPAMHETWVQPLGREDPLEKGMVTHSSLLAWRMPWTEEPGGLQFTGLQRVRHD